MDNEQDNPMPAQPPGGSTADAGASPPFSAGGGAEQAAFADDQSFPAAPPPDAQPVSIANLPDNLDQTPIELEPDTSTHPEMVSDWGSGLAYLDEIERQQNAYPEMISGWGSGLANLDEIERQQAAYPNIVWPVVPWQVGKQIGSFRAYVMTVYYVIKRFGRIGNLMDGAVEPSCARSFRRWTVLLAVLPYILTLFPAIGLWYVLCQPANSDESPVFMLALCGVFVVCNAMFIYFQSAIVGWFFCPSDVDRPLQNRCIAVSRYTIAPLAVAGLMILVIPIMLPFMQFLPPAELAPLAPPGVNPLAVPEALGMPRISLESFLQPVLQAIGLCQWIMLGLTAIWLIDVIVAAKSLARRSAFGIIATAVGVPVLWAAAWLAVWMLPATLAMWAMIFASLF
ncbi:MAG: hypothetical protein HZA50_19130 [Planctomycetes bacterium]|nr:hypothetical protein [Planctomycetota bacterium]